MTVVASGYDRRANDLYETEAWATAALIRALQKLGVWADGLCIWEPAAGAHMMVDELKRNGARVLASDIQTYGRRHDFILDVLAYDGAFPSPNGEVWPAPEAVITNPPYGKGNRDAVRFTENILRHNPDCVVAMLLTAKFDFGKTRKHLFADNDRFMAKVALLDRISWEGNGKTGTEDHCFLIWGPENSAPYEPRLMYEQKVVS